MPLRQALELLDPEIVDSNFDFFNTLIIYSCTVDMSSFGSLFRVHTYGESHCKSVGCIVDGVPPVSIHCLKEEDGVVAD